VNPCSPACCSAISAVEHIRFWVVVLPSVPLLLNTVVQGVVADSVYFQNYVRIEVVQRFVRDVTIIYDKPLWRITVVKHCFTSCCGRLFSYAYPCSPLSCFATRIECITIICAKFLWHAFAITTRLLISRESICPQIVRTLVKSQPTTSADRKQIDSIDCGIKMPATVHVFGWQWFQCKVCPIH